MNILIVLVTVAILWIAWRLYSNRHQLPCPSWLAWMVELDNPFAKAHKAHEIIQTLPLRPRIQILDIGCGPGRVLLPLAQKISAMNGHITGLDIEAGMIEKTKAKAKQLNLTNVDFVHGNIDDALIAKNYDIVLMIAVLGEIPQSNRGTALQNIAQHLSYDGIISITETIFDPHFQTHKSVTEIMKNAGFIQIKFTGNRLAYTAHFTKIKTKNNELKF